MVATNVVKRAMRILGSNTHASIATTKIALQFLGLYRLIIDYAYVGRITFTFELVDATGSREMTLFSQHVSKILNIEPDVLYKMDDKVDAKLHVLYKIIFY